MPRSRIYAIVLRAVIVSARAAHRYPATLDGADILDAILDGAEPCAPDSARRLVADVIGRHTVHAN